jgi:hypothetical protein
MAVVVFIFAVLYGLGGTKYTSLRLTSFDGELQSLKTVAFHETRPMDKGCFWYSDNLFHLMCAVLTNRPVQFHSVVNRVPRMQRELFQHLNVERCDSPKETPNTSKEGSGWEDLQRSLDAVKENLKLIEAKCNAEAWNKTAHAFVKNSNSASATTPTRKCLHLARNFNRRLRNCSVPLEHCDTVVFDDNLPFCPLWKVLQDYDTIISPHGFQLALPILAHAAAAVLDTTQTSGTPSQRTSLHVIEVRWPGYKDGSYEGMISIFHNHAMRHTLVAGHTPGGKLNDEITDCQRNRACRKNERQKDLYCSASAQEKMADAIGVVGG